MKWSEMSARERDIMIAATVLAPTDGTESVALTGEANADTLREAEQGELPSYSREVSAAWRIVDRLNDRVLPDGTRVTLASVDYARGARAWHAGFQSAMGSERAWTANAWASTVADALCQAALLVLDYDLDALPEPRAVGAVEAVR